MMAPAIYHLEHTASTNTWLSEHIAGGGEPLFSDGDAVVTYRQTDGRGQKGNHWESQPDRNICMSLLLCPANIAASESFLLSEIVSIGVCRLLSGVLTDRPAELPVQPAIKWPNDIYVGDRKICGILIENRLEGSRIAASVVGIGLNVNQERFLSDAPNPVSIRQLSGEELDLTELSAALQGHILSLYHDFEQGKVTAEDIQREYWERLYRRDGWYFFRDTSHGEFDTSHREFEARIVNVDTQGFLTLQVRADGSLRKYAFKELNYII